MVRVWRLEPAPRAGASVWRLAERPRARAGRDQRSPRPRLGVSLGRSRENGPRDRAAARGSYLFRALECNMVRSSRRGSSSGPFWRSDTGRLATRGGILRPRAGIRRLRAGIRQARAGILRVRAGISRPRSIAGVIVRRVERMSHPARPRRTRHQREPNAPSSSPRGKSSVRPSHPPAAPPPRPRPITPTITPSDHPDHHPDHHPSDHLVRRPPACASQPRPRKWSAETVPRDASATFRGLSPRMVRSTRRESSIGPFSRHRTGTGGTGIARDWRDIPSGRRIPSRDGHTNLDSVPTRRASHRVGAVPVAVGKRGRASTSQRHRGSRGYEV
jgi:hypothetical protein